MDYYYSVYHVPYFHNHEAHRLKRRGLSYGAISVFNMVKQTAKLA